MSDGWESCADVNFSMNFKATGTAPCVELPCRIQEFGQGWRTLSERRVDRRWRTAHRWLAHCRRSPLLISGANSPLAVHMGNSTRPHPLATVINKNIMPVVMDFWRSTKLLTNRSFDTVPYAVGMTTFFIILLLLLFLQFSIFFFTCCLYVFVFCLFCFFYSNLFCLYFPNFLLILLPWIICVCLLTHNWILQIHLLCMIFSGSIDSPPTPNQYDFFLLYCRMTQTLVNRKLFDHHFDASTDLR
jgi:hypothetical protein